MHPIFLTKRWQHHTASSGYDQLAAAYPGATCVNRAPVASPTRKLGQKLWSRFDRAADTLVDYQFGDYLAESRVLLECARRPVDVVHALYGDEQLDLLLRRRRWLRAPLVATFHLPTENVVERWEHQQAHLAAGIDAAVVVSRIQLEGYRRWLGADRVVFIPHGINTEQFQPGGRLVAGDERLRLVVVGEHMRDWNTMHAVADLCAARKLPVDFDAVLSRQSWPYFTGCANVRLHSGVSEPALTNLYQQADALFLPVTGATANNSVLEALACGTPVITTAVGGMTDYVSEASGWLFGAGDVTAMLELIEAMCRERDVGRAKREGARAAAITFSWQSVVEQTRAVHEAVVRKLPVSGALAAMA